MCIALGPVLFPANAASVVVGASQQIAELQALDEIIAQAVEKIKAEDWAAADPLLEAVIGSSLFGSLPETRRHALLTSAAGVALELNQSKRAQEYSVRACALKDPTVTDWQVRLYASLALQDMPDATITVTRIAKQWPHELAEIPNNMIFRVQRESRNSALATESSFDLMAALYGAHWKIDGVLEPSAMWRDYTLALLERGKVAEAGQVALRVTQPSVLISMRADRRFDALVKKAPEHFNMDRAVDADIATLREVVQKSPRKLQNVIELTYALLKARRYDEVMTITESVIQKASDPAGNPIYDDMDDSLVWVLNNRAIALGGLGRRDEELELLVRAAQQPEKGELNVSQAINLGQFYCSLERPKDALQAIVDVKRTSPYGEMQVEIVRLCAAMQMADEEAKATALKHLESHQAESPRTYQGALVDTDLDAAARLLIDRLKSPSLRSDALVEIQIYDDPPDLAWAARSRERFQTLLARDDVRQAISKVGRIESFNLRSDLP